jgi:hypothetical protein
MPKTDFDRLLSTMYYVIPVVKFVSQADNLELSISFDLKAKPKTSFKNVIFY